MDVEKFEEGVEHVDHLASHQTVPRIEEEIVKKGRRHGGGGG